MGKELTIVLAAGGTGGHIFPAEALAEELRLHGVRAVLVTDSRASDYKGVLGTLERHTVRAGTFGRGMARKLMAAGDIALGILQARKMLKRLKPQAVVGFGGYPSFPTVYAASGMGIPVIIHEQNSVLGRANRVLVKRVNHIATTFPDTRFIGDEYAAKAVLTGNPVRASIRALRDVPYPELSADSHIRILVTGGSQGASIFSQIVPAAVAALPGALRSRIRIDQQCREMDLESARAAYAQMNVSADLSTFFADIPARLASAHLVIARAGASTICELTAAGRPSIVVPLPTAMDNHQYYNANALEEAGAGWVMPQDGFTAAALSTRIESFLTLPESLARAAANARKSGKPDAARNLAALVLGVAEGGKDPIFLSTPSKERAV
jgi:UDP-N-acetylglucosamine--N-acetylmuramyl-(pentapeptide) pyrophosphoryl-undecaprenol N-acetylglucosamine transferase